jgi:hypothetical protein
VEVEVRRESSRAEGRGHFRQEARHGGVEPGGVVEEGQELALGAEQGWGEGGRGGRQQCAGPDVTAEAVVGGHDMLDAGEIACLQIVQKGTAEDCGAGAIPGVGQQLHSGRQRSLPRHQSLHCFLDIGIGLLFLCSLRTLGRFLPARRVRIVV